MVSESTRRSILRSRRALLCGAGATACASFAGCTGLLGSGDSGSRDGYGVALENELDESHTVSMRGEEVIADEIVFEETVEIDPGERREWDEVFVDHGTYRLSASVDDPDFGARARSDGQDFQIDDGRGPEAENLLVLLEHTDGRSVAQRPGPRVLVSAWGHPDDYRDEE